LIANYRVKAYAKYWQSQEKDLVLNFKEKKTPKMLVKKLRDCSKTSFQKKVYQEKKKQKKTRNTLSHSVTDRQRFTRP